MPLVSMKPVLAQAMAGGYAVAAFNPVDYASAKAMVRAAEELDAPVILQTSAKTIVYYDHETIMSWMHSIADDSPVPVTLHLDHGRDMDMIRKCIEVGWTSVMIDASNQPFEKNKQITAQVLGWATPAGVGVEAEIGEIVGVEEEIVVREEDAHLTKPEEAEEFCREFDLAAFAAAIGTAHGYYKGTPHVHFELIEEINKTTGVPMALHGGTGLSDEVFARCISLGCAKVNISTQLKHVFVDSFCDYHEANPKDYEPLRVLGAQYEALVALFKDRIAQFGGAGKGSEIMANID